MNVYESLEDYLERILLLQERINKVRSIDIANDMNFSKPSVSIAMKKLKDKEYITIDENGYIFLTNKGRDIAKYTYEKHCIILQALKKIGVEEEVAKQDACKIEHELSEETFSKLKEFVNK